MPLIWVGRLAVGCHGQPSSIWLVAKLGLSLHISGGVRRTLLASSARLLLARILCQVGPTVSAVAVSIFLWTWLAFVASVKVFICVIPVGSITCRSVISVVALVLELGAILCCCCWASVCRAAARVVYDWS